MNLPPPISRWIPTLSCSFASALRRLAWGGLLVALALGAATLSRAEDDDDGPSERQPQAPAVAPRAARAAPITRSADQTSYQQECAACHLAYPPGMLPAASWQRLMADLPHHFGTDASLEPAQVQAISRWLGAHAATSGRAAQQPPQDRITRSSWFVREHDEMSAATFKRPAIQSAANCMACHTRADQGDFSERFIRIPR